MENISKRKLNIEINGEIYTLQEFSAAKYCAFMDFLDERERESSLSPEEDIAQQIAEMDALKNFLFPGVEVDITLRQLEVLLKLQFNLNAIPPGKESNTGRSSDKDIGWLRATIILGREFGKTPEEIWETLSLRQIIEIMRDLAAQANPDKDKIFKGDGGVDLRNVQTPNQWKQLAKMFGGGLGGRPG